LQSGLRRTTVLTGLGAELPVNNMNLQFRHLETTLIEIHTTFEANSVYSVGQNVIIQAIHVNYTSWYGKLSENYAESKK